MQGYELAKSIRTERSKHPDRVFIKWWRNEEDWIDFDLVARFLDTVDYGTDISGFNLIDQEEMWQVIEERTKGRATRVDRGDGSYVILYSPPENAEMEERLPEYPYTPETLVKILDAETNFNYVD
ncbi:hypothetical protein GMSM_10810 [Geomonas sp. Red276]